VGSLGISEKGAVTLKLIPLSHACAVLAFLLLTAPVAAQEDSVANNASADSLAKKAGADSLLQKISLDSVSKKAATDSVIKKTDSDKSELVNIVPGNKKIRAYGWGEYRVNGRCLCCDKINDGDCIYVQTIERTDRERITQIVDGKVEGDTGDKTTYFGGLEKRELPKPVVLLMAEISLGKMYEIRKVIVYTMMDREKHTNFLSNCELGYYDQFGRLLWAGKAESKTYDEPITFEIENPVLTKMLLLRVNGGKNRITEVAIFCGNKK
jgi:hypothetical protein